jgi:hypothetical protein
MHNINNLLTGAATAHLPSFIKNIVKYIYTPIKTIELERLEHVPERIFANFTYV